MSTIANPDAGKILRRHFERVKPENLKREYRTLARALHPDAGGYGSHDLMCVLNEAYDEARKPKPAAPEDFLADLFETLRRPAPPAYTPPKPDSINVASPVAFEWYRQGLTSFCVVSSHRLVPAPGKPTVAFYGPRKPSKITRTPKRRCTGEGANGQCKKSYPCGVHSPGEWSFTRQGWTYDLHFDGGA
jgi:hypothetical protein